MSKERVVKITYALRKHGVFAHPTARKTPKTRMSRRFLL